MTRSDPIKYELIRSSRKTIGITVKVDGRVVVRAPYGAPQSEIERIIREKAGWIEKNREKMKARAEAIAETQKEAGTLSEAEIRALAEKALKVIPERVAYYAPKVGVTYGRITIRNQRSRWGSCSSKGNLNFNCLLMLTPPEVLDSVVVHELCHRKEMNHSKRFYAEVLKVFPDYYKCDRWLKEHGPAIMCRMTG